MSVGLALAAMFLSFHSLAPRALGLDREEIAIPDVLGYQTLKCDFHMHTVFSDGLVWPTVRVTEAWRDGLDAISITDHIEYQPHKNDIPTNHDRPYEIAKPIGDAYNLILIRGSEITRSMPPGHLNGIFLKDCAALDTDKWQDAVQTAADQGAFIFWNHPGWTGQQSDGVARWYDEHSWLLEKGFLGGMEVVNSHSYYPEVHRWCLDHGLAMLSNSDVHPPIDHAYLQEESEHRPVTLVFSKTRTAEGIHEALSAARTAVYFEDKIIGQPEFLRAIFDKSVTVEFNRLSMKNGESRAIQLHNNSEVPFVLARKDAAELLDAPGSITLPAGKTVTFKVKAKNSTEGEWSTLELAYEVQNLLVEPEKGCPVTIRVEVNIQE
jgi:hypothetical protein